LLDQFFCHRDFGAAGGLGKNAFGACQQFDRVENFVVADALAQAPDSRNTWRT
jgi:hypothetical protein